MLLPTVATTTLALYLAHSLCCNEELVVSKPCIGLAHGEYHATSAMTELHKAISLGVIMLVLCCVAGSAAWLMDSGHGYPCGHVLDMGLPPGCTAVHR